MDIRIVLNWDTDNSDIDLIVTEPFDESCSFRNKLTRIGGLLPVDMRRGYGPEEYLLREAVAGKYKIEASFFNTQQQTVTGPTTIYLDIFSKYSTKEEQKETIILRLLKEKDTIEIGEIEFKK